MNRIAAAFARKPTGQFLNVFFTAGHPAPGLVAPLVEALAHAGADLIEIGMPFSDPVADGPVIQHASTRALAQGMTIAKLFTELAGIRERVPETPLLLMGYLNPVLQFGFEAFCEQAAAVGIDALILPDLPPEEYEANYRAIVVRYGLRMIFLITPRTVAARARYLDSLTDDAFLYLVSGPGTTGSAVANSMIDQRPYFEAIAALALRNPRLIGFGIRDGATFRQACQYADGAIIGSALVQALEGAADPVAAAAAFVQRVLAEAYESSPVLTITAA